MILQSYDEPELPCEETIRRKLNELGYHPKKVRKCQHRQKIPETEFEDKVFFQKTLSSNAIFEQLAKTNKEADTNETRLRISIDAKAVVLLDWLFRCGYNRVEVKALDHDFQ